MGLNYVRIKDLSHKIYTLRQSVTKVENVAYNIRVRGGEAARWSSGDDTNDKQDDEGFVNY